MSVLVSILFGVSAMLGFGFADFLAKAILVKANALQTVFISQVIGSILYIGLTLVYDLATPDRSLLFLSAVSGCLSAIVLFAFYKALSLGKASVVSPLTSCLTVVAVVLSLFVLSERLTIIQIFIIASVFLGTLLTAFERRDTRSGSSNLSILFVLVVVFLGGGNTILQKWVAESVHYLLGFTLSRLSMLGLLACLIPFIGSTQPLPRPSGMYKKMALLGLIDVSAFFAWFMGLREGFVAIVTPIALSSSAVTIILAHIFLNERVLFHQRLGIGIIILGVALLSAIS